MKGVNVERPFGPVRGPSYDDFFAYLPDHAYIFRPTREMYPPASVNAKPASCSQTLFIASSP